VAVTCNSASDVCMQAGFEHYFILNDDTISMVFKANSVLQCLDCAMHLTDKAHTNATSELKLQSMQFASHTRWSESSGDILQEANSRAA